MMHLLVLCSLAAAALCWLGVGALRGWAERRSILDRPNERSSHTRPTPRGGGLAIVVLVLAAALVGLRWFPGLEVWAWVAWIASGAFVAAVSWVDDLRGVSFALRLAVHTTAAALLVSMSWSTGESPFVGGEARGAWSALAVVWVVGLTNAYNFMDGIDGIAGGQGVVAGLAYAGAGYLAGGPMLAWMGLACASASLGVLVHNWPPARIFMGDVGSAFLGFSFAAMAVIGSGLHPAVPAVGVLALWPFLFDTVFTFLQRLRRGENVFAAHRSHLYQRLVISGWPHGPVSMLYISLSAVGATLGLSYMAGVWMMDVACAVVIPSLAVGLWAVTVIRERTVATRAGGPADA